MEATTTAQLACKKQAAPGTPTTSIKGVVVAVVLGMSGSVWYFVASLAVVLVFVVAVVASSVVVFEAMNLEVAVVVVVVDLNLEVVAVPLDDKVVAGCVSIDQDDVVETDCSSVTEEVVPVLVESV